MGIQKTIGALLFSSLFFLVSLFTSNNTFASYNVLGQVVDARSGQGIPGYTNSSIYIYADNTLTGVRAAPDGAGYWQLSVEDGTHSIEIANAGSMGWGPASPEKVTTAGNQNIIFRINRGFDVVGRIIDQRSGNGIPNVTVYSDFSSPNSTTTDFSGNYRLTNLRYGGAGHTIYVRPDGDHQVVGSDYQVINPPVGQTEASVNFTLTNQTYPTPSYNYPTPYAYPTPSSGINASCNLSVISTSGTNSPVYTTLQGTFSSNNLGLYYPMRYDWDYNGDGNTDNSTATTNASTTSPQGILTAFGTAATYRPQLRVYYQGSSSPAICASNQTITVNPQGSGMGNPYCSVTASQTATTVPFYVNFSGAFYNQGGSNYTPNRYRFYVGNERETIVTNQFSTSANHYLETPGSREVRLEVRHEGGTTICYGPTVNAYSHSGALYNSSTGENQNILGTSTTSKETGFGRLLARVPQTFEYTAPKDNSSSPMESLISIIQKFLSGFAFQALASE